MAKVSPRPSAVARPSEAAMAVVDDYLATVRARVLTEAAHRAAIAGKAKPDVEDVVASMNASDDLGGVKRRRDFRTLRVFTLATVIGGVGFGIAVGGLVTSLPIIDSPLLTSLALSLAGALVALAASIIFGLAERRDRNRERDRALGRSLETARLDFLNEWIAVESLLRSLARFELGLKESERPFGEVVRMLARSHSITDRQADAILEILGVRNAVVHGRDRDVDYPDALDKLDRLTKGLENSRRARNSKQP